MTTETAVPATPPEATPETQPVAAPRALSRRSRLEMILFLVPGFIFQTAWGWYPIIVAFFLSMTNVRYKTDMSWVGTENYNRMLLDPSVGKAFGVTFNYALLSILLTFVIPIIVAILLMEMPRRTMRWMMLLWFLPLSGIASTILWRYFYNTDYGLFQYILTGLGFPPQRFLSDANMVLFWLIVPGLIFFGPGLIYMAALQGIPASYYEAAEVEGASFWRKIWTISLPRLRPVISMMLTFAIIGTLQEFNWPQIMTEGQPGGASRTIVMYVYNMWQQLRLGDATALAVMVFAVILVITIIFRTVFKEDPDA